MRRLVALLGAVFGLCTPNNELTGPPAMPMSDNGKPVRNGKQVRWAAPVQQQVRVATPQTESRALVVPNLLGCGVGLEHPERVPVRVDEIAVPTYTGHGELR